MNGYSVRRSKREMISDLPEEYVTADHIGHSTLEYTTPDGRRIIRFHRTNVVTFHPNGDVTLDSGGHQSFTTKKRFNEHLPYGAGVFQHKHEWYVQTVLGTFDFYDGFTVDDSSAPTEQTIATAVNLDAWWQSPTRAIAGKTWMDFLVDAFEGRLDPRALDQGWGDVDIPLVFAHMARLGRITMREMSALPPALQVQIDQVLEQMPGDE